MKILLIAEKYPPIVGGGETHVHQLAEGLAACGHQVTVVTEALPDSGGYRSGAVEIQEVTGLMDACRRLECKAAVEVLHGVLSRSDADIVHVFNYVPALLVSWLRSCVTGRLVVSLFETLVSGVRVFDMWHGNYALERTLQRGLVAGLHPDLLVCGSRAYVRWAREAGFTEPIERVEFGTDLAVFRPDTSPRARWRAERDFTDDDRLIVVPARPVPRKRFEDAISALARLRADNPRVRLILPEPSGRSDSAYVDRLRKLADELEVTAQIHWEPGLGWHEMPTVYNSCDAALLPSSHEGFGIALIEAMACRCPVITSDVEGHDEIVTHNDTGLLYPAGDVAALTEEMAAIIDDDTSHLVDRAQEEVRRRFSRNAVVTGHLRAYRSLLDDGT